MAKRPDVGEIAEQVIERLKQIEDQVTQNRRLVDELGRLRDLVKDLERAVVSRFGGERYRRPSRPRGPDARRRGRGHAGAARSQAGGRRPAPRGQNKAKILAALKEGEPMTATEIARATGISAGTVSTTLNKMAKTGELTKAERGYRLPDQARAR
jgi:DNA-binding transcriptional ArsR family regulator